MGGKQADRKAKKVAEKEEPQETSGSGSAGGKIPELAKTLMMGSCLVEVLPKLPALLTGAEAPAKAKEEEKTEGEVVEGEVEPVKAKEELVGAEPIFDSLKKRLVWHNCLGLADPATAEDSLAGWLAMKGLELDWGPQSKRKGNPGLDRIVLNVHNGLPQYVHFLLALMVLRAFLLRSFFACLPWLVFYQIASLLLPLEELRDKAFEALKKPIPDQIQGTCPIKFRVAGTMGFHALVWFFFIYEALWKTNFYEKIPLLGLIAFHAYATRPVEP